MRIMKEKAWKRQRMNKAIFASLTILCLLSISSITGFIQLVKAQETTITINADGSITPPTAPISSVDNVTYTFTGNISYPTYNGIVVERNNTVIDGNGYTLQGNYSGSGISLTGISNVTIENINIQNFQSGIWLYSSSNNNTISGNNATANIVGINLISSSNNIVSGNNASAGIAGGNTGSAIPIPVGIGLDSSSNNNTVSGNTATANGNGIELYSSSGNVVSGNNVTANSGYGIALDSYSNNNVVNWNNVVATNSGVGIWLYSSSNNTISRNTATNGYGFFLDSSSNNTVSGNNVTANNGDGIELYSSNNNKIYHNNFVNNTLQVSSTKSTNVWDDGYPSGGNYWSDYQTKYPNAIENDSSGIWNTPYVIDANNTDYYPLMNQVTVISEFQPFILLPLFMVVTLLAVIIYKKKGVKTSLSHAVQKALVTLKEKYGKSKLGLIVIADF